MVMVYSPYRSVPSEEKQEFWTDSNGRQMIKRVQDTRFSYDLENGAEIEPVSSNYYPINSGMYHIHFRYLGTYSGGFILMSKGYKQL